MRNGSDETQSLRTSFFTFHPIHCAFIVANILREKFGPGDEAKHALTRPLHVQNWSSLIYLNVMAFTELNDKLSNELEHGHEVLIYGMTYHWYYTQTYTGLEMDHVSTYM